MTPKFTLLGTRAPPVQDVDATSVLNALGASVLVLDALDIIRQVNVAAENFFESGAGFLCGRALQDLLPHDCPLFSLIAQTRIGGMGVVQYGVTIDSPRTGQRTVDIHVSTVQEAPGVVVISLHEQSIAMKIGNQLIHRKSARSVSAIAALLAHEVKNPLSGIRGAAQILEQYCGPDDQVLARLIRDEADRIFALVDRMELFSDSIPMECSPVNIHAVLEHVRRIAQAGFGRHLRFIETYDPSLPKVLGNRDRLIQVFLNLVKNAAEAAPTEGGEVTLGTAFQHGLTLATTGNSSRVQLPLVVTVQDNGQGIPADIRPHLFDPFVTSKATGSGLGLSLVAKIVGDHGGIIELDSQPRRTTFRVMLPIAQAGEEDK